MIIDDAQYRLQNYNSKYIMRQGVDNVNTNQAASVELDCCTSKWT